MPKTPHKLPKKITPAIVQKGFRPKGVPKRGVNHRLSRAWAARQTDNAASIVGKSFCAEKITQKAVPRKGPRIGIKLVMAIINAKSIGNGI